MIDSIKLNSILITSPVGSFVPGSWRESPSAEGEKSLISFGTGGSLVSQFTDIGHQNAKDLAELHMRKAANYLGIAEVLKQREEQEKSSMDYERRKVLNEFGFFGEVNIYSDRMMDVVDTLIRTRKSLEELAAKPEEEESEEGPKTIDLSRTVPVDGEYTAFNIHLYGPNPPERAIRKVRVIRERIYTQSTRMDLTHNFHNGRWVLIQK